ncbi:MAG: nuclear transport factor 2 family protein [Actinomycetota bacterium]|nr:nuclear transport factor 2 family protein [Actinomycetota bacterium]
MSDERVDALERRIQALEDERAIARLIASYGPLVDVGDSGRVSALWSTDGGYDVGDWVMSGRHEIAAMVESQAHQGLISRGCCHFFGPPVVTVTGDSAVAVCESILVVRNRTRGYEIARAGVHLLRLRRGETGWEISDRIARQLDGSGRAGDLVEAGLAGPLR